MTRHYRSMVLSILGAATLIIGLIGITTPASAQSGQPGFLGENPSGKLGRDGQPLRSFSKRSQTNQSQKTQNLNKATAESAAFPAECPPTIRCVVVPAAYSPNNGNVEDYGNYDKANRPTDMTINSIVIHDTEGDLQSVLDAFTDPSFYAATHYVINTDGTVYQMIPTKDVAWHAGNWSFNMHSIGIEHVGFAAKSESYTPAMYYASEQLVNYLTQKYKIPRDREHVIGHDNVPATSAAAIPRMHVDPGPFWNWQGYMTGLGGSLLAHFQPLGNMVTVAPNWPLHKQPVTGCTDAAQTSCVPAGLQPTNFVYLRTEPRSDAPFFTDPVLGQGSTDIKNNAARLFYGQTFAVADKRLEWQGVWYQVWVNGLKGWFYSPWTAPTAYPASGKYITPKPGKTSVAVYGRAIPERSEYPADLIAVPPASFYIPTPTPLPYTVASGQRYKVTSTDVPTDHFYAWASDASFPYDHTVFKGKTKYIEIQIGNRLGYVKADEVVIQ